MYFEVADITASVTLIIGWGLVVGLVFSTAGAAGGFLLVPFMSMILHLPMYVVAGTSALAITLHSITSIANYVRLGVELDYALLGLLLMGLHAPQAAMAASLGENALAWPSGEELLRVRHLVDHVHGENEPDRAVEVVQTHPVLAGQHSVYTAKMLKGFRAGENWGEKDAQSQIMNGSAAHLTDEEIEAVASYIEGLHLAGD